jgi:hypothetical protein
MAKTSILPVEYNDLDIHYGWSACDSQALRFLILGRSGSGKSTWIASNPKALILDFDGKAEQIPTGVAASVKITDMRKALRVLRTVQAEPPESRLFAHICLDSLDEAIEMAAIYLAEVETKKAKAKGAHKELQDIRTYGKEGLGYQILRTFFRNMLVGIERAGFGWTAFGHLQESIVDDQVVTRAVAAPSVLNVPYRKSMVYGFMHRRRRKDTKEVGYYLSMRPEDGTRDAKNPYARYMPEVIELSEGQGWNDFTEAYDRAAKQYRKQSRRVREETQD